MAQNITKLVLPMAGLGKRLMPLTKRTPKNLLKINGTPLVEYALEEAREAGIKDVIFIVNPLHKRQFNEYVTQNKKRFPGFRFHIRVQETPSGNGHALLPAADILKNDPFVVRFCDDVIRSNALLVKSLISLFHASKGASVVLLERVPKKDVSRYGVVAIKKARMKTDVPGNFYEITQIIEKPQVKLAPSQLIIIGGYALAPTVLRNIRKVAESLPQAADDALPIAVGLQIDLIVGKKVFGWQFPGTRLDCGTLEKFRKTEALLEKFSAKRIY